MPGTSRLTRSTSARTAAATGDGVLARLLLHLDLDAGLAVDPHERSGALGGVLDLGDVAQVDRHAVARHHDEVADVVEALELALAADEERRVALVDLAERRVLVLAAQRLHDVFTDRLSAVIFSFDSSTWICRRTPPLTVTAATPSTRSKRGAISFCAISRSVTGS